MLPGEGTDRFESAKRTIDIWKEAAVLKRYRSFAGERDMGCREQNQKKELLDALSDIPQPKRT